MKTLVHILAAAALTAFGSPAHAQNFSVGDIQIENPWAKPSLKGVPNGAAYMTITNRGETDETLLAAAADVSSAVELHTMSMTDGVMRMRQLQGGVALPAGQTVKLEPGGMHVMFIGLKQTLTAGESVPVTLTFEQAGTLEIEVNIKDQAAGMRGDHDSKHQHGS